jgi:hypothetical protein
MLLYCCSRPSLPFALNEAVSPYSSLAYKSLHLTVSNRQARSSNFSAILISLSATMRFISLSAVIALAATAAAAEFVCQSPTVVDQTTAGQNGEVAVKYLECANQDELRSIKDSIRFARRQTTPANVCGNTCTSIISGREKHMR